MKAIIEKELCNPVNGELVGPMYHVYKVSEDGSKEFVDTIDGDIKEAARLAERKIDFNELEVAYQKDPDAFCSVKIGETLSPNVMSQLSSFGITPQKVAEYDEALELYLEIDTCISKLIKARIEHDDTTERECVSEMESLMVKTQQHLSCEI